MTHERRLEINALGLCRLREERDAVNRRIAAALAEKEPPGDSLSPLLEEQKILEERIDSIESGEVVLSFSSPCAMVLDA